MVRVVEDLKLLNKDNIMLYILRSPYKNGKTLLKVGYANDIDTRISQYKSHNPGIELISYREGSLEDERILH